MDTSADNRSFIDFLRGIAIFLMLWGHCVQYCCGGQFDFFENAVFKFIYTFHMPLFMLISGYLFCYSEQKRGLVELIEYKAKSLLYPILMCSALNALLSEGVLALSGRFSELVGSTQITSLWFIWSVIAGSTAVGIAVKITKNTALQGCLIVTGILLVMILPCWEMNIYMYPYFVIGYLYSRNQEKIGKFFSLSGVISAIIFSFLLFFYQKKHYIYTSGLYGGNGIIDSLMIDGFRWAIGLFGSIAVAWLCKLVHGKLHGWSKNGLEELGKNSLAVYALSVSLLSFWLPRIAGKILSVLPIHWNNYIWLYNLIVTPIAAVAYSMGLLWIIKMMKKYNVYRLVFGR